MENRRSLPTRSVAQNTGVPITIYIQSSLSRINLHTAQVGHPRARLTNILYKILARRSLEFRTIARSLIDRTIDGASSVRNRGKVDRFSSKPRLSRNLPRGRNLSSPSTNVERDSRKTLFRPSWAENRRASNRWRGGCGRGGSIGEQQGGSRGQRDGTRGRFRSTFREISATRGKGANEQRGTKKRKGT